MTRFEVVVTDHAVKRFRQRVEHGVSRDHVESVVESGRIEMAPPCSLKDKASADAFVITRDVVFPLRRESDGLFVAVTAINRHRRSKPWRRAWVQWRRDEQMERAA